MRMKDPLLIAHVRFSEWFSTFYASPREETSLYTSFFRRKDGTFVKF